MKKRIIYTCVILVIFLLLIYFIALPIIKWNLSYDLSSVTSGEKAVEYYLNSLDEKNPKKSITVFPSLDDHDDKPEIFDYLFIKYCKVESIEEVSDYDSHLLIEGEKMYRVDFSMGFLFPEFPMSLTAFGAEGGTNFFRVAEDKETGNWYIVDIYPLA